MRPDKRRRRDGAWVDTKLLRPHRSVNVVASMFGRWYYLGTYQCAAVATLDAESMVAASIGQREGTVVYLCFFVSQTGSGSRWGGRGEGRDAGT